MTRMARIARTAVLAGLALAAVVPAQAANPHEVCEVLQDPTGDTTTFPSSAGVPGPFQYGGIDFTGIGMSFAQDALTVRIGLADVDAAFPPGTSWALAWVNWEIGGDSHTVSYDRSSLGTFFSHIVSSPGGEFQSWTVEGSVDADANTVDIAVPRKQLLGAGRGTLAENVRAEARLFPGADAPQPIGLVTVGIQIEQDIAPNAGPQGSYELGAPCA